MKKIITYIIYILIILVILALPVGCSVYKYKDCKNVGHKTVYCVIKLLESD